MKRLLQFVLPVLILMIGVVGAVALIKARPVAETIVPEVLPPLVRVQEVSFEDLRLTVRSQGTVVPRTESVLVPEVSGRVIEVSPSFAGGGFFESNEVLLRIDRHDYEQAVIQTEAQVAAAGLRLAREEAEAEVAIKEWKELDGGAAPPLTAHVPQLALARAEVRSAEAALERARRNLERTAIRAPFAGRVRSKQVDVGQFVAPGTPLARIYAVDRAEVRLPIPDEELAYLDLPLGYRGNGNRHGPEVVLSSEFAGKRHRWNGRIVRTEGEIDPRSRMVHVVAGVNDPYGRGDDPDRPPLAVGMYVQAEILGRSAPDVVVLPRASLREDDQVLIVDADDRLRFRRVEVLRTNDREAIVRAGLAPGERVCLSPLSAVTDGMRVRINRDAGAKPQTGAAAGSTAGAQPAAGTPQSNETEGARS